MVRGLYISATGMLLQRRKMETITHNITNADTVGYKKDHLVSHSFDSVLIQRINDFKTQGVDPAIPDPNMKGISTIGYAKTPVGPLTFGALVDQVYTDFTTGSFEETMRTTDLALVGDGFFAVETPAGERYTRCGAFTLNAEGYLTDADGNYVLGANGRIRVGGLDFAVNVTGDVYADGVYIDRLRIVSFADNGALRKQGDNLYMGAGATEATDVLVKQGFLENSNIDVGREMVDMITVYRAYEVNQKVLTMIDETVGKAVNEIGRLR